MKQQTNGIDKVTLTALMQLLEKNNREAAESKKGKTKPKSNPESKKAPSAPKETEAPNEPKQQPAMTFMVGNVSTRIWANQNEFGQMSWTIDQRRTRLEGWGTPTCKTLRPEHLQDAMRGLYKAQGWIKKAERRLRWSRLFL